MIVRKTREEIAWMRKAGRVVASVLDKMRSCARPGVTTGELDRIAEEMIVAAGARPAFKGYRGFPASICTSVNEQVVHGIPGDRVLREGDVIGIDVGAVLNGFYGDGTVTLPVGEVSPEATRLIRVTEEALYKGVDAARAGNRLSDISRAIQTHVESAGFSVVRSLVGHGIGRSMHEEPQVPNFVAPDMGPGPVLKTGMTLAIEPMVNAGGYAVTTLADEWTVVTCDSSLSAHFEHTVAVGPDGPEVLTRL